MAILFISRHPGSIAWMKQQPIHVDRWLEHLQIEDVKPNDVVIGILPIHLACQVCEMGARFLALDINMPSQKRGVEMSEHELNTLGCSIHEYVVHKVGFAIK